ncbi:hypothetical protein [Candidatus Paracaedibacter symbiosus]|uniref:hypothetical protein n=1 Tax=Candidatus Paracaedibacter symbiosus TaxID=244582 RepID=UPI000509C533|nr:hypothetical protein [Candidatus Paracaedibacter symbiosus]
MFQKMFLILSVARATIYQPHAMEPNSEIITDTQTTLIPKKIPFVIHNTSSTLEFRQNQRYSLIDSPFIEKDLGTLKKLRFRVIPGAITENKKIFTEWMNYNSCFNPATQMLSTRASTLITLQDPASVTKISEQHYNNLGNNNLLPKNISITEDLANSKLLTVIYSFDISKFIQSTPAGGKLYQKMCFAKTFILDVSMSSIESIDLTFYGFKNRLDTPNMSLTINKTQTRYTYGYINEYSN